MKIGIIANCQAPGLAQCVEAMVQDSDIEVFGLQQLPPRGHDGHEDCVARVHACDLVLTQPVVGDYGELTVNELRRAHPGLVVVPNVVFGGFHPDCCYLHKGMQPVETPTHHYNSALIAGAYLAEIAPDRVPQLFNQFVYRGLGFHEEFAVQADELRAVFNHYGYDADRVFSARPVFMHTPNHPCIQVLFDLADQALRKAGITPNFNTALPPDRLELHSTRWPVYPDLASPLGVSGGTDFAYGSQRFDLKTYVRLSYQSYASVELELGQIRSPEVKRAMEFLKKTVTKRPSIDSHSSLTAIGSHTDSRYAMGQSINFGHDGDSERLLLHGWSGQEPGFRWTENREAAFHVFPLTSSLPNIPPSGYQLELDFFPMTFPGSYRQTQRLELLVNGNQVHEGDHRERTKLKIPIPSKFIDLHKPIVITLRTPESTRPHDINPANSDTRQLGFAIYSSCLSVSQ